MNRIDQGNQVRDLADARLYMAGWSIGDVAFRDNPDWLAWLVRGSN